MSEDFGDSSGTTAQDDLERIAGVLDPYGYQPCVGSGRITLGNCPYRALTAEYRGVVCRMNLRLLKGVLKGAGTKDLSARPDPSAAPCCVTITAR
ncbi:MAG TPA: hypothetical protein VMF35_13710 [Acidimicrobiales bacterium]|nr:hypothetical protein [Acidimicrobiales bacterium]